MSLENHIGALKEKHAKLEASLEAARKTPAHDPLFLTRLKKEKLAIKDAITDARQKLQPKHRERPGNG